MQPKPDGNGAFTIHLTKADAKCIADLQSCCRLQPELEDLHNELAKFRSSLVDGGKEGKVYKP